MREREHEADENAKTFFGIFFFLFLVLFHTAHPDMLMRNIAVVVSLTFEEEDGVKTAVIFLFESTSVRCG